MMYNTHLCWESSISITKKESSGSHEKILIEGFGAAFLKMFGYIENLMKTDLGKKTDVRKGS